MSISKKFSARLENLHVILAWIESASKSCPFTHLELTQLILACEEAIVNVMQHAYQGENGEILIKCTQETAPVGIEISIQDWGVPFDPIAEAADLATDWDRPLGGCGILLILEMVDGVGYKRIDNANILKLSKYCSSPI